jgi:membrane-associated phospholipid phosphatase
MADNDGPGYAHPVSPPYEPVTDPSTDPSTDPATEVRRQGGLALRLAGGAGLAALVATPFVFLMLLVTSESEELESVDRSVADAANAWAVTRPWAVDTLDVLEQVLAPWTFRAVVLVAAVLVWRRGARRLATWAVTTMAVGGTLGVVAKSLVERARPTFAEPVATASWYSFPSGHALNSMLGAGVLLLLALPHLRRRGRIAAWATATAVVALTGFDRIGLGVHFLSDVLAGWVVALAVLAGTTVAFGTSTRSPTSKH